MAEDDDSWLCGPDLSSDERRKAPREALVVKVEYETVDQLFTDFSANINEGGIFIESDAPQPPGTRIELEFRLPGTAMPIAAHGMVVHVSDGDTGVRGMGVEFEPLDPGMRRRVDALVRSLRSD